MLASARPETGFYMMMSLIKCGESIGLRVVFAAPFLFLAAWTASAQTPQVQTSKPTYAPGESITVTFNSGPGNAKDWIAIYPKGVKPARQSSFLWL